MLGIVCSLLGRGRIVATLLIVAAFTFQIDKNYFFLLFIVWATGIISKKNTYLSWKEVQNGD